MKKTVFTFVCIIFFLGGKVYSQEEWTWISQPGETLYIVDEDVSFFFYNWPNGSHGSKSHIEKSSDGGHTYSLIWENIGEWGCYYMEELFFLDADTGFFGEACAGTVVYMTNDGGDNWSPSMGGAYGISMFFLRSDYGYYTTEGGGTSTYFLFRNGEIIFETPDYIFANEHFYFPWTKTEIYFKNDSTGLIMCKDHQANAVVIKTTDYGITWTEKLSIHAMKFNDMVFITETKGFVVGNGGILLMTDDFGETWNSLQIQTTQNLNSIDFADDGIGYITGNAGTLLKSEDEGQTWQIVPSPSGSSLIYTKVFDNDKAFVLTEEGDLYSNQDNTRINEVQKESLIIYPNPATNEINVVMPAGMQTGMVSIFDLNGRLLLTSRQLKIPLENISKGLYLIEVNAENRIYRDTFIKR